MKLNRVLRFFSLSVLAVFATSSVAFAQDAKLAAMVNQLQTQMNQMKNTVNWQNERIVQLQKEAKSSGAYVMPTEGDAEVQELPKWIDGLKFKGDLRLRYEATDETSGANAGSSDRNRFRYRLRFGFEKEFSDEWAVGFRLVSAANGGQTSTNTTFDTQFDYDSIAIDRAYATYTPEWAKNDTVKGLEITAGKFKNPFRWGSSWILWDSDVTPEGIYEKIDLDLVNNDDMKLGWRTILGQMVLEEGNGGSHQDAELYAFQTGLHGKLKSDSLGGIKFKSVASLYVTNDYHVAGNFTAGNNPLDAAGNLAAGDFRILEFYNEIGTKVGDLPFKIYFDTLKNLGNEAGSTIGGGGAALAQGIGGGQDHAWMLGAKIGKAKKKGSWELKYEYAVIEENAVFGAFTDSDFGGSGRRGSVVKGKYAITDNLKAGLAFFWTNRLNDGTTVGAGGATFDETRRLWQFDLAWKF